MDRRRLLFTGSIALFVAWLAALGAMAALSSRKPVDKSKKRPEAVARP